MILRQLFCLYSFRVSFDSFWKKRDPLKLSSINFFAVENIAKSQKENRYKSQNLSLYLKMNSNDFEKGNCFPSAVCWVRLSMNLRSKDII